MFMRKIRAQDSLPLPLHVQRSGPALRTTSIMVGRMSAPSRIGAVDADPESLEMHQMALVRASPALSSLARATRVEKRGALEAMSRWLEEAAEMLPRALHAHSLDNPVDVLMVLMAESTSPGKARSGLALATALAILVTAMKACAWASSPSASDILTTAAMSPSCLIIGM